jgi:dipeptidyl aminopeptidase/acylaminoacyl peptidase
MTIPKTALFALLMAAAPSFAQAPPPPASPVLSPAICGPGTLRLFFGEQAVGEETFEIRCRPEGGYAGRGHTRLTLPGAAIDLESTVVVDATGSPLSSSARGTAAGRSVDQAVAVSAQGSATVTRDGQSQTVPFERGSVLLGSNVFYMLQLVLARYDPAVRGPQPLKVFPAIPATLERVGIDDLRSPGDASGPVFDRYRLALGPAAIVAWLDAKGRLAALVVPAQSISAVREEHAVLLPRLKAALPPEAPIDYSAPVGADFTAEEVKVPAEGFTLAGTLLLPRNAPRPLPVVVTITGSGQQTRDEPIPMLAGYRPFRQIAESLARRGLAVLRVDDRGAGGSGGSATLGQTTTADYADDVRAQVAWLRGRRDIDPNRIALLGHSEGALIAPMVAATDPKIAAVVLMAGTADRGEAILKRQLEDALFLDPSLTEEAKARRLSEQRELLRRIAAPPAPDKGAVLDPNVWLRYFASYDPLPALRQVTRPLLILQGGLDRQVSADQADKLARAAREAGHRDVTVKVFPTLNHLFLPAQTGSVAEYASLRTTAIGSDVLDLLADWLRVRLGR